MLEVAFITDAPRVAGSEVWLRETLPLLPALGVKPTVYLAAHPKLKPFSNQLGRAGITTVLYRSLKELSSETEGYPIRVLQSWFPKTYAILLSTLRFPLAVYIHDQLEYHYPLGLTHLFRWIYGFTKAKYLHRATCLFVGTYWASSYLQRHFGLRAHVVPVGVDPNHFKPPTEEQRHQLRHTYRLERFTLITPARFTLEKNQISIAFVAKLVPEAEFLLVGEGNLARVIQTLSRALRVNNVRFLKPRLDVSELYRASDAVLFPTLGDNPGLVILEGMASGLPVITSPFPPQKEVLSPSEGLLVPPTPRALAKVVRWLQDHPTELKIMGQKGRERILRERTNAHSAQALVEALHQCLNRR
ncbi:glycosyltransferase family 4 protein [Thermus sediminis]|uniref:glycosyltransferase family 4 protein n=1 Tax=Thermus sediminis TaxID=1761908 RepID=UPI0018E579EB|nr:glycosyltransferase family 4 protein [Thermus sediminis]